MSFNNKSSYTDYSLLACFLLILLAGFGLVTVSCGGARLSVVHKQQITNTLEKINTRRSANQLAPLLLSAQLSESALRKAEALSSDDSYTDDNPSERIVSIGCYARFVLTHHVSASSDKVAFEKLSKDPLFLGKAGHGGLSHVGFGVVDSGRESILVVDLARLSPAVDKDAEVDVLKKLIQKNRTLNSAGELEFEATLKQLAGKLTNDFMSTNVTIDQLISEAQKAFENNAFSLGRVTIAFQVADSLDTIIIPERVNDPFLSYAGIGVTQGNHPEHEPGSIAVAIFLGKPQGDHEKIPVFSNLPPPKVISKGKILSKGSILDQAWTSTLSGNHRKAASLFEKAYKKTKNIRLLYECARAHARDDNMEKAINFMGRYAEHSEGDDKKEADEMVAKLQAKESIFSESSSSKMSVEARRFFVIGQNLFSSKEWNGAIDAFQQAYAYAPHAEILYNIGLAHIKAGRVGTALDFFAEYQKMVPDARNVEEAKQLFEIGVELYRIGQYESAARRFAMAYGHLPIPDLVYNLALCNKAMGFKDEAIRLLREFLDTNPSKKDRKTIQKLIDDINNHSK